MQKELLNHALSLFDTPDKWDAFADLANQKEAIKGIYFKKVKPLLLKHFNENPVQGWVCEPWGDASCDLRWYLSDCGKDSLSLAVGWRFHFVLHLQDTNSFNTTKVDDLLRNECSLLLAAFDRVDRQFETQLKAVEVRNYTFGSAFDGCFEDTQIDKFAWFAGNKSQELADQIIQKVEKFRKNEKLTEMLRSINNISKIVPLNE